MLTLQEVVRGIAPLHDKALKEAQRRVDQLIKPIGSLGKLENIAVQLSGISGEIKNIIGKKCTIIMSADNGVVEEGVACTPQEITVAQSINMIKGVSGIAVLSKQANADVKVVDIGIYKDIEYPGLIQRKIRKSTWNMAKGPAMTREEAIQGIEIGIDVLGDLCQEGYTLFGTGEMGVGNTSTSSAIVMSFTGYGADFAVGKGAGLSDEGLQNKKRIIEKSIEINHPNGEDPVDVLSKVGGFDICGLVGCYLAAAYYRVPIVIDGVISAAAAYTAYKINPLVRQYMISSHCSLEPAYELIMKEMKLEPMLQLDMRLGEGTGCPLAFHIIESAAAMMNHMPTFAENTMRDDFLIDIR